MANVVRLWLAIVLLAFALAACSGQAVLPTEGQVLDVAWQALEPNTSSHSRANWQVAEVRQVAGREVAEQFEGEPAPACPGPKPPANGAVRRSGIYWYVELKPRLVTPVPQEGTVSPTAPPAIPESFTRRALFLVDAAGGRVVARKLYCVIY
jgi:hypothetical protein